MKIKNHAAFKLKIKKKLHSVLIKDFNRFMTNRRKHQGKKHLSILLTMLQHLRNIKPSKK